MKYLSILLILIAVMFSGNALADSVQDKNIVLAFNFEFGFGFGKPSTGGAPAATYYILLESADTLVTEAGDKLRTE
jgi:hypothetical protein